MNLYLDDDIASLELARLLRRAGHDVVRPADNGLSGHDDPVHLTWAIEHSRVLFTANHRDYLKLHNLLRKAGGHDPGIITLRRENDPRRDLTNRGIVVAMRNLEQSGLDLKDGLFVLNHWR
jgi:hypothetical protein